MNVVHRCIRTPNIVLRALSTTCSSKYAVETFRAPRSKTFTVDKQRHASGMWDSSIFLRHKHKRLHHTVGYVPYTFGVKVIVYIRSLCRCTGHALLLFAQKLKMIAMFMVQIAI